MRPRGETTYSLYDYSREQLTDKKFLKAQIAKYAEKIKKSKETTANLKFVQDSYKGLLKQDSFYVDIYCNRKEKPVENPCKFCGQECYGGLHICNSCSKKAKRKDKGMYQLEITCPGCAKQFYPKSFYIPFVQGDIYKCSCKYEILISAEDLKTQERIEYKKYHYPEIKKIAEEDTEL